MYLLKCWRDARLSIVIYLIPIVVGLYNLLRHTPDQVFGAHASVEFLTAHIVSISGALLLFVGWSAGGDGIGREIAEDRGAYLLTRPRSRRFFLWSDSGFSFGLMAVLAAITMLIFEVTTLLHIVRLPPGGSLSALVLLLVPLSGVVFAGLVYGVTYLCTMLVPRHSTARVVSMAVLIGYLYLHVKSYKWGGVTEYLFPTWWVDPFPNPASSAAAPHVWLELGARVLAIVVLLLAAQFVLERREIRA